MATTFEHESDRNRYVMRIDGDITAVAEYVEGDTSISFNHTFTNPKLRGHGYAGDVVNFAIDDVEKSSDRRVIPMCWYVAKWFDEHPERAGLLTR